MTQPRRPPGRISTVSEGQIRRAARRRLAVGGPEAMTLRAIARDIGVSAPALYRHVASLEDLTTAVVEELVTELLDALASARVVAAGQPPTLQLAAVCRELRDWSLRHPAEFGLLSGASTAPCDDVSRQPPEMHPQARLALRFSDLVEQLVLAGSAPRTDRLSVLSCWTRLYGLVRLEVSGGLRWALDDPAPLFERALRSVLDELVGARPETIPASH